MDLDWDNCPAVSRSPKVVSGAVVFKNSRLPVSALFENLKGGATVDEFLEWYEGVSKEQVYDVLQFVTQSAESHENFVRPKHA